MHLKSKLHEHVRQSALKMAKNVVETSQKSSMMYLHVVPLIHSFESRPQCLHFNKVINYKLYVPVGFKINDLDQSASQLNSLFTKHLGHLSLQI